MKIHKLLIVSFILILITISGIAQNPGISKWVVDDKTSFTFQSIINSEKTDTVVFLNDVSFNSEYMKLENVEKIIYNKNSKKLIIISKDKGDLRMNDGKNGMKLVSTIGLINDDTWKKANFLEYTIGEHSVYVR